MAVKTIKEAYLENVAGRFVRCLGVMRRKNGDYAHEDNPFVNFETAASVANISVEQGIIYHVVNKLVRIQNLLTKDPDVVGESLEDSVDDAINYLNILGAWVEKEDIYAETFEVEEEIPQVSATKVVDAVSVAETWFQKMGLGRK